MCFPCKPDDSNPSCAVKYCGTSFSQPLQSSLGTVGCGLTTAAGVLGALSLRPDIVATTAIVGSIISCAGNTTGVLETGCSRQERLVNTAARRVETSISERRSTDAQQMNEIFRLREANEKLTQALDEKKQILDAVMNQKDASEKRLMEINEEMAHLGSEFQSMQKQYQEREKQLRDDLAAKEKALADFRKEKEQLTESSALLSAEGKKFQQMIHPLQQINEQLSENLGYFENKCRLLHQEMEELKKEKADVLEQLEKEKVQSTMLLSQIEENTQEREALQAKLEEFERRLSARPTAFDMKV